MPALRWSQYEKDGGRRFLTNDVVSETVAATYIEVYLLGLPELRVVFRWKSPLFEAHCSVTARSSPCAVGEDWSRNICRVTEKRR